MRLWIVLGLLLWIAGSSPVLGQGVDPVRWSAEWCHATAESSFEVLESQGCRWERLHQPSGLLGVGETDIWLRVRLINETPETLERWLTLGNSRLQRVELFQFDGSAIQLRQQGGMKLAGRQISPTMRRAGAFSLTAPPLTESFYWIRIRSDSLVAVDLKLWQPEALQATRARHDGLWLLGLGMSVTLIMLSLAMGAHARERGYLYFALAFSGQILIQCHFSGVLQRGMWPVEWPMPFELALLGTLLLVIGGTALVRRVAMALERDQWLLRGVLGAAVVSTGGLLASVVYDYPAGAHVWMLSGVLGFFLCASICASAWRAGSEAAGYLFVALLLLMTLVIFRILELYGYVATATSTETWMIFLSFTAGALVLWSLVQRSVETGKEIQTVKQSAASQLALFARVSHELRTPLDTILGNAQLLMRQRDRPPDIPVLKVMLDSGRHLLSMIDELLDYARGVTGALKIEPVATRFDIWLGGLERTGQLLAARNQNNFMVRFDMGDERNRDAAFVFDAGRLRQIMDNLLVNAARYTREGSITLGGHLETAGSDRKLCLLHLYVEDTGRGIAPEDHERIFEPFERLDRTLIPGGVGTGMGLAIARQLTTLMGGELTVLSALGRGARFSVKIPIRRSVERVAPITERTLIMATGYLGVRRKLLLVDDDDHSRHVMQRLLESVGFEIREANGGREAERLLESEGRFDAVLTDQFMADGDGWWTLWAAKKFQPEVPVMLVSAALPHEPLGWGAKAQFDAVFLRPLKHEELLQRLGDLLELEWIFDQPIATVEKTPLSRPAREHLVELQQLVAFGEVTAVREWAPSLRIKEPKCADFADAVEKAVMELDFGRLELLVADE